MPAGRRKLSRAQIAILRRSARKRERFIADYRFPDYIWKRARKRIPDAEEADLHLVERGLREWFICCAWRGRNVLGMPSRAVDEAWHEFILDSLAYTRFCDKAFGSYLHHTPDEAMSTPMGNALVAEPLGIDGLQLASIRASAATAAPMVGWYGGCAVGGGGEGGGEGGCGGGGCSGGDGGGCGGGCGGGGGS